ncbi:hypothetical protein MPLA_1190077 [Mesorhizobium sp. ORS 3359]|nr:hypothetical protein MPLA_1190077 [Mesorhizobium sp. ORS 3359]
MGTAGAFRGGLGGGCRPGIGKLADAGSDVAGELVAQVLPPVGVIGAVALDAGARDQARVRLRQLEIVIDAEGLVPAGSVLLATWNGAARHDQMNPLSTCLRTRARKTAPAAMCRRCWRVKKRCRPSRNRPQRAAPARA